MNLLPRVLKAEGFGAKPYRDTRGTWTFGHGLTWISEAESERIVAQRLRDLTDRLLTEYACLTRLPLLVLQIVTEMAYQMGFAGTARFVKMWAALEQQDFATAADEMMDSAWYRQTPNRTAPMAEMMRTLE